jgi:hypothetical protein
VRTRLLSLIVFAAAALASCQKENQQQPINQADPLIGTWSIVKINSTTLNAGGQQVNTNIYQQPLSDENYIVFSADSNALWNVDHFYMYGESGNGVIQQSNFRSLSYRYLVQGKSITMTDPIGPAGAGAPMGPMGARAVGETETATLESANSLVIHSTYTINDGSQVVADTYYTK